MMNRRGFIGAMGLIIASPAIVRASSLMPVRALPQATCSVPYITLEEYIERILKPYELQLAKQFAYAIIYGNSLLALQLPGINSTNYASPADARSVPSLAQISPQSRRRLIGEADGG